MLIFLLGCQHGAGRPTSESAGRVSGRHPELDDVMLEAGIFRADHLRHDLSRVDQLLRQDEPVFKPVLRSRPIESTL